MAFTKVPLVDDVTLLPPDAMVQALSEAIGGASAGVEMAQTIPSASWTFTHNFPRRPSVTVFLSSGEEVDADVIINGAQLTVVFASPQTGSVVLT